MTTTSGAQSSQASSPSIQTVMPEKPDKLMVLVGCMAADETSADQFTLSDTKAGVTYRLSGTKLHTYTGHRVRIVGGSTHRRTSRRRRVPSIRCFLNVRQHLVILLRLWNPNHLRHVRIARVTKRITSKGPARSSLSIAAAVNCGRVWTLPKNIAKADLRDSSTGTWLTSASAKTVASKQPTAAP